MLQRFAAGKSDDACAQPAQIVSENKLPGGRQIGFYVAFETAMPAVIGAFLGDGDISGYRRKLPAGQKVGKHPLIRAAGEGRQKGIDNILSVMTGNTLRRKQFTGKSEG